MERRLAAVLAADVVGYTRMMGADEAGTLVSLKAHRQDFIDPTIAAHRGRLVKLMGDGALVSFASAVDAVACADAIQRGMAERNAAASGDQDMVLRIGINLGEVIVEGEDIYGDGVNIAARLEALAPPGGICLSAKVHEEVKGRLDLVFEDLGVRELKNVAVPVRVFRLVDAAAPAPSAPLPSLPEKPSIAVLPFENMSGDPEQDYFAEGIADDILTGLARLPDLFVIDRHASFTYRGKAVSCQQVGRELGVRFVLEGSVRRSGNRVRITAQLIDATGGSHVWAERFDRTLDDIFALQDEISRRIVTEILGETAYGQYGRNWQRDTENFEAWDCMLQIFSQFFRYSEAGFKECIRLGEKALALDPDFGSATAALGWSYHHLGKFYSADPQPLLEKAAHYARRAVTYEKARPHGLLLLAYFDLMEGDHEAALAKAKEAVALAPNSAETHVILGRVLNFAGRPQEAIAQAELSIRLSPIYPGYFLNDMVEGHRLLGDLDRALEWCRRMVERMPESYLPMVRLAGILSLMGRDEEAREAAGRALALHPGLTVRAFAASQHFRDPAHLEPLIEALRKAGLPD